MNATTQLTEDVIAALRDAFYITVGLGTLGYRAVREQLDDLLPLDLDLLELPSCDLSSIDLSSIDLPKIDLSSIQLPGFELPAFELPTIDFEALRDSVRDLVSRAA